MTAHDEQQEQQEQEMNASFGMVLRKAREAKRKSIEELALELCLDTNVLQALESESLDQLPEPIFTRGYIRKYTRLLGIDSEQLVAQYNELVGDNSEGLKVTPQKSSVRNVKLQGDEKKASRSWFNVVVLALLLIVAGVVWFVVMDDTVIEQLTDDQPSTALEIAPAEETSSIEQVEQPLLEDEVQEVSAVETPQTNELPSVEEPLSELVLQVSSESWAEIHDARGERVVYDLLKAGSTRVVHGVEPFKIFLGAADDIRIELNGEFYDHSKHIRKGLARFELGEAKEIIDQE